MTFTYEHEKMGEAARGGQSPLCEQTYLIPRIIFIHKLISFSFKLAIDSALIYTTYSQPLRQVAVRIHLISGVCHCVHLLPPHL